MILFLGHSAEIGGAEIGQLDMARHFRNESRVLLFDDGPFRTLLETNGIDVTVIPGGESLHGVRRESRLPGPRTVARVMQLAHRVATIGRNYDVLYANTQKAFVIACMASPLCGRPVIWHLHDILSREHFSETNIRLDVALANRVARRVIAVSRAVRDAFVERGGKPGTVRVVHNGVDSARFDRIVDEDIAAVRDRLGIAGVPVVSCFSRLTPWKGQHDLIEAMAGVPDVHLLLAGGALFGSDGYERRLRTLAVSLDIADRVHFLGMRDDVPLLMRASDVIVHCSVSPEPFARVVVEAMLAGRPLVAARDGGVPEIVEHDETGILFEPRNVRELRDAIAGLFADPGRAAAIGQRARSHAARNFGLYPMMRGIEAQIRELQAA